MEMLSTKWTLINLKGNFRKALKTEERLREQFGTMEVMSIINKVVFILTFVICLSCQAQQPNSISLTNMHGRWTPVKFGWWQQSKYTEGQVQQIAHSTLCIESNKVYFDSLRFIDTCKYTDAQFLDFFNETGAESDYAEDYQYLFLKYMKSELGTIKRVELDCKSCVGDLYLKGDTLLLNFCGGVTFYFTKENKANRANVTPIYGDTVQCLYRDNGGMCSGYVIQGTRAKGCVVHVSPVNKNVPFEESKKVKMEVKKKTVSHR